MPNEDGTQACETEYKIVLFADKEKRQHTLFPEVGIADTIVNNGQVTHVVVLMNRGLGTDDGKGLLKTCHRLTDVVGIALNTCHGLC